MATLRDDFKELADGLRAIAGPSYFDWRPFSVTIRTRSWSGGAVGSGTPTVTDLALTPIPRVIVLDGAASLKVGPITPSFAASDGGTGGYTIAQLSPQTASGIESYVRIVGPQGVQRYSLGTLDTSKAASWFLYLLVLARPDDFSDF